MRKARRVNDADTKHTDVKELAYFSDIPEKLS